MQNSFTTTRLTLTPLSVHDVAFIYELVNTEGWVTFIGNRNINTHHDSLQYIERLLANPNIQYWVVTLQEGDVPIGIITFIKRDSLEYPDLGFAFLPKYNGHGYAYEAAKIVLDALVGSKVYKRILATTVQQNMRSIQLLQKLGFHHQGTIGEEHEVLFLYAYECEK